MSKILSKKEAIDYLGLEIKTFDNYFKIAKEFSSLERNGKNGRFLFDEKDLGKWKEGFEWRTVELTKNDYAMCLDFALAMHFRGYVTSDFGSGRQREFGQKITNWVKGQLGEMALQKFFLKEFGVEIKLDFDLHNDIVPQDILAVKKGREFKPVRIGVGIKSSKPKNAYLILASNEIERSQRKSEVYVFCRVYIPDDHLIRVTKSEITELVKNQPHFDKYIQKIPDFEKIPCEIAGWCWTNELEKTDKIPGQNFDGFRYVQKSGLLRKTKSDWMELIKLM